MTHINVEPLYRRGGILVTYDVLEVAGRSYSVSNLRNLRTSRGGASPVTWWMVVLSGSVLAAFGVALSFGRKPAGPSPLTYAVLVCAAAAPVAVALCLRRRARRSHELWGDYQGGTHLLYAATDEREFGRVTRALVRACEAARTR